MFAIGGSSDRTRLFGLFDDLDIEHTSIHEAASDRPKEYRPLTDASALGRILSLLGAPVGPKNAAASIHLLAYLDRASEPIRRAFVDVYLQNRGHRHGTTNVLTLREERSDRYLRELAALISEVSGGTASVSEKSVILASDAVRGLRA